MKQLVYLTRFKSCNGCSLVDKAFVFHVNRNLYCCGCCSFAVSCLEHKQFVSFNCKFHILHIAVVFLENFGDSCEVFVNLRKCLFHLCYRLRCSDTCNNVFALCVYKKFSENPVFAVCRVSRECNTCSRCISHIAEYHRLYVYCSTQVTRNIVELSVKYGSFVVP